MSLSDGTLARQLDPDEPMIRQRIRIEPRPDPKDIQPASIDVHLDDLIRVAPAMTHRLLSDFPDGLVMQQYMHPEDWWGEDWRTQQTALLVANPLPHMVILGSTIEHVTVPPTMEAILDGKSTLARKGLKIHNTAGYIDPGFQGNITLEVSLVGPMQVLLTPGMKIGQIRFQWLDQECERPYGHPDRDSHYQYQTGATPAAY